MIIETLRYFLIAFISSAVLIILSKIILQHLIRRPADYYSASETYQEEMMLNSAGFSINDEIKTNPEGELTDSKLDVVPQITAAEAVKMNLIERERIPEDYRNYGEEPEEEPEPDIAAEVPAAEPEEIPAPENEPAAEPEPEAEPEEPADQTAETEEKEEKEETLEDIRKSLEAAYKQQFEAEQPEAEAVTETAEAETEAAAEAEPKAEDSGSKKKSGSSKKRRSSSGRSKGPNPSMKMKKSELEAIAASMGIELEAKDTKRIILDKIYEVRNKDK